MSGVCCSYKMVSYCILYLCISGILILGDQTSVYSQKLSEGEDKSLSKSITLRLPTDVFGLQLIYGKNYCLFGTYSIDLLSYDKFKCMCFLLVSYDN